MLPTRCSCTGGTPAAAEPPAASPLRKDSRQSFEPRVWRIFFQFLRRWRCRRPWRIGLPDSVPGLKYGAGRHYFLHDVRPASVARPTGYPPPTILPKTVRSGSLPKQFLGTAIGQAETGHHLVVNRQGVCRWVKRLIRQGIVRRLTNPMFPATGSRITPAILSPRASNSIRQPGCRYGAARVYRWCNRRELRGCSERRASGRSIRPDEQRIHVAVITTGELHNEVPAGEPASQADGAHGRLVPLTKTTAPSQWMARHR